MSVGSQWRLDPDGPYIRMGVTQGLFHLMRPRASEMNVRDIAFHLAGINRYTGASRYTVAQHCVIAAAMADKHYANQPGLAAKMLIHDVAEAYYGDMSSPLKTLCPEYRVLERLADAAVEERFGVKFTDDQLVKEIDDRMWLTEARGIYGNSFAGEYSGPLEPFGFTLVQWPSKIAEERWLAECRRLLPGAWRKDAAQVS